jgi:xylulokinase
MILAVDVGTSLLKAALFAEDGTLFAREEAPLSLVRHTDPLRHEVDALQWIAALRGLAAKLGLGGALGLSAIVLSGNGPTLLPTDAEGRPLANAMTWMDRRAAEEAELVAQSRGSPTDAAFLLPKALWLFRHRPELYARARHFFSCPEYLTFVLTGEAVTFLPTPEYRRGMMWDADSVRALGMDPGKFPPFVVPGSLVGRVGPSGAEATGIPAGIPVFAGAPDFIVSLLGTATVAPGRACVRSGTSEGINLCSSEPTADRRLLCVSHIAPGFYNVSGVISTSGKALEWFREATDRGGEGYEELLAEIEGLPAGANRLLFLPYLAGERAPIWDPQARGAFIGLTLNHRGADMTRAVVESVAYAIRDVVEVMEESKLPVRELRITGSPSRSALWNQIKADVTGRRILVPSQADPDLVGDACLALFGLGEYASAAEASEAIVSMGAVFEPDPSTAAIYDEMFGLYRDSYAGLRDVFARLSAPRSQA